MLSTAGGAPLTAHKGQCMTALLAVTVPSSFTTSLTMPAALHTICSLGALTMGEATATPSVKANHSSAKRASQGVLRKVCKRVMGRDYGITGLDQK